MILSPNAIYPTLIVIDADEERLQRVARIFTLAHYRVLASATPFLAFQRIMGQPVTPNAILVGAIDDKQHFFLSRLLQRFSGSDTASIPLLSIPIHVPDEAPLVADISRDIVQHSPSSSSLAVLEPLWHSLPWTRQNVEVLESARALQPLTHPAAGPRISRLRRSRNSHFRQLLQAAYDLVGSETLNMLLADVGLTQYTDHARWPPQDNALAIPAEYISCLHQAIAFSDPINPVAQLRRWSDKCTQVSLPQRIVIPLAQQAFKLLPRDRALNSILKGFARELNDIRGEDLHHSERQPDGSYLVIHYSNLYAYGRLRRSAPQCHVWLASLETTLRLVGLDTAWHVTEQECSCQTLTGHCIFALYPR